MAVLGHVHDPLLCRDLVTGALLPGVVRGGARQVDEKRYVLELDDRACFHDGIAVTTEDLAASVRSMIDGPTAGGLIAGGLDGILAVTVRSRQEVEVRTDGPLPLIDERLCLVRVLPQVVLDGGGSPAARLIGTGPYRIAAASTDAAVLDPFAGYRLAGRNDVREPVELLAVPEAQDRVRRLLDGDVVAIEDPSEEGLRQVARRDDLTAAWVRGVNMTWLMFNCAEPRLGDPRVRRALALAIDREELSQRVHGGRLEPSGALLPSWHPDSVPSGDEPGSDPQEARVLLREAGFGDGMEIELLVSSASWVERQAGLVVDQLARIGVIATPRTAHTADLFADEIPAGRFQVLLSSGDPSLYGRDGEFLLRWYLTGTWARRYCHLPDTEVTVAEALVGRLARTAEPAARRVLLGEIQQLAARTCALAVLGHRPQPTAWNRRLTGFRPSPSTGLDLRTARLGEPGR